MDVSTQNFISWQNISNKDGDGDYDLVPKDVKVFCCYGSEYDFVSDLYWENTGGQFIRRIND